MFENFCMAKSSLHIKNRKNRPFAHKTLYICAAKD